MPDTLPHISIDHIPDADFQGVGRVAVAWSYLEGAVERISWVCSGLTEASGICLTTHIGIKNRIDAALALLNQELPDQAPTIALNTLQNEIMRLYGRRNEIVHSRVFFFDDAQMSFRRVYKARGKINSPTIPIRPEEYKETADQIIDATNKVMDILNGSIELITEKRGARPPWPDRP